MKKIFLIPLIITFSFLCLYQVQNLPAQDEGNDQIKAVEVFDKIPDMRNLVKKKMQKCAENIAKIAMAMPIGDYETIVESAGDIDEKYAIESSLSPEDLTDYYSMISSEFVLADQDLHQYAVALKEAAKGKFLEQTQVQYDLTLRSCVSCHYSFAKEEFPKLARSVTDY